MIGINKIQPNRRIHFYHSLRPRYLDIFYPYLYFTNWLINSLVKLNVYRPQQNFFSIGRPDTSQDVGVAFQKRFVRV